MKATSRSDRGTKRRKNRDAVLIDCEREMFFLADGLGGGHPAGEIASDTSVRTAYDYLKDRLHDETDIKHLLAEAVKHAHHCLQKLSGKDRTLKGMGTTIVLMIIKDRTVHLCHVGDSRAYLIQTGKGIRQVTEDHTFQNFLNEQPMLGHLFFRKKKRILMQALGISKELSPASVSMKVKSGDIVLLCSDGLTDMLSDEEILSIIRKHSGDIESSADKLVETANAHGGIDNISVVLVSL